jgi:poly-D-alanine transfer protein DltD
MVPSAFIFLDALPLSANGKVDRRALPTQESLLQKVEVAYVAPQTDIEQIIASVWQELLGVEKVGVNDNFFDLGGNSLLLTKTYSEFKKRLPNGIQSFSLIDLFNYSTIKSLSQHLAQKGQITAFSPQAAELEQKLNQGKERLKQRLNKSRLASR